MTVRIYRSTDSSAPVLSGSTNSFIAVLDACLVNGYTGRTPSGWSKSFSGTGLAVYRPALGNRYYMRVDDTGAQESRISCFLTMSDVNNGTGQFPLTSQIAGGLFLRKSSTIDTVARAWLLVATERSFYFFSELSVAASGFDNNFALASGNGHMFFGDFISYKPNDIYNTAVIATHTPSSNQGVLGIKISSVGSTITGSVGHYLARSFSQFSGSISFSKCTPGDYTASTAFASSTALPVFPDPITGGMLLGPVEVLEGSNSMPNMIIRGRLPGLWSPLHNLPGGQGDTFDGVGDLTGKSFMIVNTYNASVLGRFAVEISDTW